jgi:hypothetical protein
MRELGSSEWREIEVFASVSRGCQERLVWPDLFPAKSVPKAGLREDWLALEVSAGWSRGAGRNNSGGVQMWLLARCPVGQGDVY